MNELMKEFPELQWENNPTSKWFENRCKEISSAFMKGEEIEIEKKRRVKALMIKYRSTGESDYYELASKMLSCNNISPCESQACIQCEEMEKQNKMCLAMRDLRCFRKYVVVAIDVNSMADESPISSRHCVMDEYIELIKNYGYNGFVFASLTMEIHSFPGADGYKILNVTDVGYFIPQIRLLIEYDGELLSELLSELESYVRNEKYESLLDEGYDIKNEMLERHYFTTPESATAFAFDKTVWKYSFDISYERYIYNRKIAELNDDELVKCLIFRHYVGKSQVVVYSKDGGN